ncbi:hypothetical protein [Cryobacterium sp. Y57]|uniref:hypothetical protein n=1 Tax=Cryobacterium sp. Y57 TaxID=2048287 RepID=UPI000CE3F107|nr:hypothetical protein [Cryobacterium sp. Y57]
MITNLYSKYLLADRLNKVAEAAGLKIYKTAIYNGDKYNADIQIQLSAYDRRNGEVSNGAERAAIRLLDTMPELALERDDGLIHLTGIASNGLTFSFYTGSGSCELVQVGTRTLPAEDAKPEREEPIFEKRCIDELAAVSK